MLSFTEILEIVFLQVNKTSNGLFFFFFFFNQDYSSLNKAQEYKFQCPTQNPFWKGFQFRTSSEIIHTENADTSVLTNAHTQYGAVG